MRLSSPELTVEVAPAAGGKLSSLRWRGGPNVLLEPEGRGYLPRSPGMAFEAADASGFDECFPSVAATAAVPDHGDLWTARWSWEQTGPTEAVMAAVSASTGATLERTLRLEGATLRLDYLLRAGARGADYLWSAHPLLAVEPGARIVLPAEVESVEVEFSRTGRVGPRGGRCGWPRAGEIRLDGVGDRTLGEAEKLFAGPLRSGVCRLLRPAVGLAVELRFDPGQTEYLGLWICQGGWPLPRRDLTVALEPCTGAPDSLDDARRRGLARRLERGGNHRWWLELEVRAGEPASLFEETPQ